MTDVTLAELCIFAASEAFRSNGEIVATGVGPVPRLAASLAKLTHTPELMMTDGEAYLVEQPVPLGPRGDYKPKFAGYLPFSRFFDSAVWSGRRHAMVTPTQIDRFGQINLSQLGGTHKQPKTQMLGVRGFLGWFVEHSNLEQLGIDLSAEDVLPDALAVLDVGVSVKFSHPLGYLRRVISFRTILFVKSSPFQAAHLILNFSEYC